jgi:hypothetical protein
MKYQIRHIYDIDNMSVDEIIQELEKWAYCYKDWEDNYDSCLLLKTVKVLKRLKKNE